MGVGASARDGRSLLGGGQGASLGSCPLSRAGTGRGAQGRGAAGRKGLDTGVWQLSWQPSTQDLSSPWAHLLGTITPALSPEAEPTSPQPQV